MKKQLLIVGALACLFANEVSAQEKNETLDEVVVSATKFNLKKENTAKVITKITQEELQNNAGKSVIEVLNNVAGVEIKGVNTNPTEPRGTFIRGGRSRQVLVLVDGVPVSDPTGINQEYDLRFLSVDQIESIEILKGASSTLYGSGAATGVINIILKKASKNKISGGVALALGTNNTVNDSDNKSAVYENSAFLNGTLGKFNYLATAGTTESYGMSSAKSNTNARFEKDSYKSTNGMLKLGYDSGKRFAIETFVNYDKFDYDFDAGLYADDAINNGNQHQIRVGFKPSIKYTNGEFYALASFNDLKREINQFSSFSNSTNNFEYEGQSYNVDLVNKYQFKGVNVQLITGVQYQNHNNNTTSPFGNIEKKLANFNTIDPYVSAVYISDFGLNVNLGGRLNNHSEYGSNFVYDANASYNIFKSGKTDVKVLASYSTAFIAPSTYQLFSVYGNTDLEPETSKTLEAGVETSFGKLVQFDAVYFNRKESDAIIFQSLTEAPWGKYANAAEGIEVSGVEANVTVNPIDKIKLNVGYTYTDKETQADYIPKHKMVASLESNPFTNAFVSLVYKNVGDRTASFYNSSTFSVEQTTLPTYNLFDVNANYKFAKGKLTLFGTVSNLFNEDYEDVLGYSTRGRNYKLGLRVNL